MKTHKCNLRVRNACKEYRVPQWMLADALKVSPDTVTRRLRHELPEEEQDRYIALIKEASENA